MCSSNASSPASPVQALPGASAPAAPHGRVREAVRRIARLDPEVNAWVHVIDPDGLADAAAAPAARLAGVPIGVKDVIDVRGMPTRCGSPAMPNGTAEFDAACIGLLRAAGAVPIGKTVTAEFAYVHPGPTRNPADLRHTPGGSSSGSAAAVAAGMVPIALGTQTGGSIIRPAAFCGVFGFKPTFGAVARDGMKVICESLDVIGWYGSSLAELGDVASILSPYGNAGVAMDRPLRMAVIDRAAGYVLEPSALSALRRARDALVAHGASIVPVREFAAAAQLLEAHRVVMHYEYARSMLPVVAVSSHLLSAPLLAAVEKGLAVPAERYLAMKDVQVDQRARWADHFADADVVLTFSALGPAPRGLHHTGDSAFNKAWSLLGWPCLHLPTTATDAGLPLGVQLVGPPGSDAGLLAWGRTVHPVIDERQASSQRSA